MVCSGRLYCVFGVFLYFVIMVLKGNVIEEPGVKAICDALKKNKALKTLNIGSE